MRAFTVAVAAALAAAQPYGLITNLPGWEGNNTMYSGYITVNQTAGRALFFWFVQSSNQPDTDPLVYWTNGGPGCSGIGGGLFSESGPFRPSVSASGTVGLVANPWSWSSSANVLYVEQPAGVGFSYSNTTSDYTVGDARAAADVYMFLQNWLAMPEFSGYRANPLFITGESYGGHYVPTTSAYIVQQNLQNPQFPKLNFRGLMVGNAWTDAAYDNTGAVDMWYWHGMISNASHNGILNTCNMSDVGPLMREASGIRSQFTEVHAGITVAPGAMGFKSKRPQLQLNELTGKHELSLPTYQGKSCNDYQNDATNEMGNTDIYDLYVDVCLSGGNGPTKAKKKLAAVDVGATGIQDSNSNSGCAIDYDPCIDTQTGDYLNRADVQAAIYVNPALIPGGSWAGCSNIVNYSYTDLLTSMIPVYQYLLSANPQGRYLVFTGDVDGIVPFTGTREWMASLGWPLTTAFHPYNTSEGQVAGYSYTYTAPSGGTLTFASVRNAGHLVPTTQGSRGLQLFNTWMSGQYP